MNLFRIFGNKRFLIIAILISTICCVTTYHFAKPFSILEGATTRSTNRSNCATTTKNNKDNQSNAGTVIFWIFITILIIIIVLLIIYFISQSPYFNSYFVGYSVANASNNNGVSTTNLGIMDGVSSLFSGGGKKLSKSK